MGRGDFKEQIECRRSTTRPSTTTAGACRSARHPSTAAEGLRRPSFRACEAEWTRSTARANASATICFGLRAAPASPLVVFIHGGYWQRGDRKDYGFLARELNARGITVALPSYTLCPAVKVIDIVAEMRRFLKPRVGAHATSGPFVVGHSAGGHLAAAMLATDWSKVGGVPPISCVPPMR